jgi:carbon-monoxide dehydrogenase medium subunit
MGEITDYIRASTVKEACTLLEQPSSRVIAGGTDILLKIKAFDAAVTLIDISGIQEITRIQQEKDGIRIGAAARLADILRTDLLQQGALRALVQGAGQVGSPQTRSLGTIGGNLCNASPSADTAAPLLVLGAYAEIEFAGGRRSVPLDEFFKGPGKTILKSGELLTSIFIPYPQEGSEALYLKHSPRKAMDLAIVGVAVFLVSAQGKQVRIALSAAAPTPFRASSAERFIDQSAGIDEEVLCRAAQITAEASKPIDDVRSSAAYRKEMAAVLTLRALKQVFRM